jgi:acyl-coenzyme A thioesterase PaaI-like protein
LTDSRADRQHLLRQRLQENPLLTDHELASVFGVSVQTIRLDRMSLGIPELRQRVKDVAERVLGVVRSIGTQEIVGEVIDIVLGKSGVSILETTQDMAFLRSGVVRGHYIYSQAESLAIALVDAEVALTGLANVKYRRPVKVGEKLVTKAEVIRQKGTSQVVLVVTRVGSEPVFRAKFVVFAIDPERADRPIKEAVMTP